MGRLLGFLDMYWLHFVKAIVLARCQTKFLKHVGTSALIRLLGDLFST